MKTKVCCKCGVEKLLMGFYFYPSNGPNRTETSPDCMACRRESRKLRYEQNERGMRLNLYYEGQLLQSRACFGKQHKEELLRMFKKIYGPRFKYLQIELEQVKTTTKQTA